jgi:hypothetical protein
MSKLIAPPSAVKYDSRDSPLGSAVLVVFVSAKKSVNAKDDKQSIGVLTPSIHNPEQLLDKFDAA